MRSWRRVRSGQRGGHTGRRDTRGQRGGGIGAIEWAENTGRSAEWLIRPVMRGYEVREQPIPYRERAGETKLDPLRGGAAIAGSVLTVALEERLRDP